MAGANRNLARAGEPGGLWHQPSMLLLLADVLMILGVIGFALAAWSAMQRLPMYPLREVVLAAQPKQVSSEQIAHVVRTTLIGNFFTVDLDAVRSAIEELPWVRKAAVRRVWPDSVEIAVEEHDPVAIWRQHSGETGLINRQGEVFLVDPPENAHRLPRFTGPGGAARDILTKHTEFNAQLAAIKLSIDTISVSPRGAWRLRLDDGLMIDLGRPDADQRLTERVGRLTDYYSGMKNQMGGIRVADLRYPNGIALGGSVRATGMAATGQNL